MESKITQDLVRPALIEINLRPEPKELRIFCGILVPFSPLFGFLFSHYLGPIAWWLAAVLAVIGVVGLVQPALVRWFYIGWMVIAFPIGWIVSHTVMALVYFGMFFPLGLLMRLFLGYDPLGLKNKEQESFWIPLEPIQDKERYFRQF